MLVNPGPERQQVAPRTDELCAQERSCTSPSWWTQSPGRLTQLPGRAGAWEEPLVLLILAHREDAVQGQAGESLDLTLAGEN